MTSPKCPICRRPAEAQWRPFCSKRCADVDLSRWLTGGYAIPAAEAEDDQSSEGSIED
jgi:endogenous inhibitor of DNA gyrase (YacG/DUF329 family)